MVINRIHEKEDILKKSEKNEICLLGHSQFDQWDIKCLCNLNVRNCGISGITLKEYIDDIVLKGLMDFSSEYIIILLGTNDTALDISVDEIVGQYSELLRMVNEQTDAIIYLIECLNVSGRLDRSYEKIDEFNLKIRNRFGKKFYIINMTKMDDSFGNLNYRYTTDGLYFNENGFKELGNILEKGMRV